MTLLDLNGRELFVGTSRVDKGYLGNAVIYEAPALIIQRYNPVILNSSATLSEFDYLSTDGARLTTLSSSSPNHRFVFNRNSSYLGSVGNGETAVFEYVLKKPSYVSGLRSIVHLDLTAVSQPFFFNLYLRNTGYRMEYYWNRNSTATSGEITPSIPSADKFIIMHFVYKRETYNTTFSLYINGQLAYAGAYAPTITATAVHKGYFNYANVDAGLLTSMTAASAGANLYELASYDLKTVTDTSLIEKLITQNYKRAQSIYNI